jgi:hypothetical protein
MKAEIVPMRDSLWPFGVVGDGLPCTPITAEVDTRTGRVELRLVADDERWGQEVPRRIGLEREGWDIPPEAA